MLTWLERLAVIEEVREGARRKAREPTEHDRHLRETGGVGHLHSVKFYYPDPHSDKLLDFTEHLKQRLNKDGA